MLIFERLETGYVNRSLLLAILIALWRQIVENPLPCQLIADPSVGDIEPFPRRAGARSSTALRNTRGLSLPVVSSRNRFASCVLGLPESDAALGGRTA